MPLVVDASVALEWAFNTTTAYADHVLGVLGSDDALVPSIWPAEVANGLLSAERRGHLDAPHRLAFLALLHPLDIIVEATGAEVTLGIILDLAREQQLTVYDAMYLHLALREALPLATLDSDLRTAAERLGVHVIKEPSP